MKLGYSTWGMPTVPVDSALAHLAALGFDGVELTVIPGYSTELSILTKSERRRILKLLKKHGLDLPAIAGHTSLMEEDAKSHAANLKRLKQTIDLAVDWAGPDAPPAIDTTAGSKPEEWGSRRAQLVERTQELADYAQAKGVTIAMEPHVGSIIDTPQKMVELIELVGLPNVKVNFDISHFNVMGFSIEESVSALAPHAVHTHVKDETGRAPNHQFLIPGEGVFDYVTYLKSMQRHGYTGYISAEVSVMVQRRPNYDPLQAATQTYATLAAAFESAGIDRSR
ncbi:MAG: sugar phosphate isomerase/epimerase [Chloroflexi bacterium]|nr:sugar phosphate isomerase/epimerase [Chloroflexota bacterium]